MSRRRGTASAALVSECARAWVRARVCVCVCVCVRAACVRACVCVNVRV